MGEVSRIINIIDFTLIIILFISTIWRIEIHKTSVDDRITAKALSRDDSTALKGLSALFVIAAHVHYWLLPEILTTTGDKIVHIFLAQLGGMGVMLFFFLSGYGIQEGYGYRAVDKTYLVKRAQNVLIPYVILKLVFLLIDLLLGIAEPNEIMERLFGIVTLEDWFILVIVIEYVFYYLARKIIRNYFLVLLFAFNVALSILFIMQGREDRYINSMWLFLFGIIVSMYQSQLLEIIHRRYYFMLIISLAVFVGLGAIFVNNKGALWSDLIKPVSGMALCIFLICILQKIHLDSGILSWSGKRSLYLYIVHVWAIIAVNHFLSNSNMSFVMLVVVTIILVQAYL